MSKRDRTASRNEAQGPRPGQPARGTRTGRPLLVAFDLLGRRWALRVLWELREEHLGFRALQVRCEGMSSSVLRDRLAELVGAGLLETDDAGHYGQSRHGHALLEALKPLSSWAEEWSTENTNPGKRRADRQKLAATVRPPLARTPRRNPRLE